MTDFRARQDVFDYIEMFYSPVRKYAKNRMLSPVQFERQQILKTEGVRKTRGYSEFDQWPSYFANAYDVKPMVRQGQYVAYFLRPKLPPKTTQL
jgi:hypothetical protein